MASATLLCPIEGVIAAAAAAAAAAASDDDDDYDATARCLQPLSSLASIPDVP